MMTDQDWTEDGQHLRKADERGRTVWMAHCSVCGMGVEELRYEPPVDYLCAECMEDKLDE